jgi:hypothetical protein
MRRLPLLIVLVSTACVNSYPGRIRPGSNVVLPAERSLVGEVIGWYVCDKDKKNRRKAGDQFGSSCGSTPQDTIPSTVPPAKRP